MKRWRHLARTGLAWMAASMLSGCVQDLFFHPDQRVYATPAQAGVVSQDLSFETADGSRLHGLWLPAASAQGSACTIVHAHGNAANLSNHLPLVAWLPARGVNVLMFDYRGYGRSEGQPSLSGVVEDVEAAVAAARRQPGVDTERVLLFGQSLGGATALRAAQRIEAGTLRGLIVDSAFASYRGIADDLAGQTSWLSLLAPVLRPWLPPAAEDPVTAIGLLKMPVWLIHGDRDGLIDIAHSEQLFAAAHAPKQLVRVPGGMHIDALTRIDFQPRFLALLNEACGTSQPSPPP